MDKLKNFNDPYNKLSMFSSKFVIKKCSKNEPLLSQSDFITKRDYAGIHCKVVKKK